MAIRAVKPVESGLEAEVQRLMAEHGLAREAADLVVAVERGYALVGDREKIPPDRREAVLAEEEAAEPAYLRGDQPSA
jgi:hypothetical protein